MSTLTALNGREHNQTSLPVATEGLSEEEVAQIKAVLVAQKRHNVFVNKFDRNKPFRVSVRYDNAWHNFGTYLCLETATAIAAAACVALFGTQTSTGLYDEAIVAESAEYNRWVDSAQGIEVMGRAIANLDAAAAHQ